MGEDGSGRSGSNAQALGLVERDQDLACLERLVQRATDGVGAMVAVVGPAGIGKTRLLAAARIRARAMGALVLAAAGGELEQDVAFGVTRQLFERPLATASEEFRAQALSGLAGLAGPLLAPGQPALVGPGSSQDAAFAVRHGLYWLTANLAERAPLFMVVDDAHWIDSASAAWLVYLARRIEDLGAVMALGLRTDEPEPLWLAALEADGRLERIELRPLSERASVVLVERALGPAVAPELCLACHKATAGNPFFLEELVKTLASGEHTIGATSTAHLAEITPRRISRFVLARLARWGEAAGAVAAAVSVLGDGVTLRHVAALADLDAHAGARAADALVQAQILTPAPLRFVHPLIRSAVYGNLPHAARAQAHAKAAQLLGNEDAAPAVIAAHLLLAEAAGDQQVVDWLRAAGRAAVLAGAPKMAVAYLQRALAEPPSRENWTDVLHELGRAELLARQPTAIEHLHAARDATTDPASRAAVSVELAQGLIRSGHLADAGEVLDPALAEARGQPPSVLAALELYRTALGIWLPAYASALHRRVADLQALAERAGPDGRGLALALAYQHVFAGAPIGEVVRLLEGGLDGGRFVRSPDPDGMALSFAVRALTFLDELEWAESVTEEMAARAKSDGSIMSYAASCTWRAGVALARGSVRTAETDARSALELAREHGLGFLLPYAASFLGEALLEQGALEAAANALDLADPTAMGGSRPEALLLYVRGRTALARGDRRRALDDLRACQSIQLALGFANPNVLAWRSALALALAPSEPEEATAIIGLELDEATRFGQPRGIGAALRTSALVGPPDQAPSLLRQAVDYLACSPARLEQAKALVDLGAALRRLNRRAEARGPLEQGFELAHRCEADGLEERARRELVACGARPRRPVRSGVEALTVSELRVAELAASGMNNREIAQSLFVSMRTVATHLGHAYDKLGVGGRGELATALAGGRGQSRTARAIRA